MSKDPNAALPRDEAWYGSLFEQGLAGLFVIDSRGRIVECNRALAECLGYSSLAEIKSRDALLFFPNLGNWSAMFEKLRQRKAISNDEWRTQTNQGNPLWLLVPQVRQPAREPGSSAGVSRISQGLKSKRAKKHLRLTAAVPIWAGIPTAGSRSQPAELVVTQVAADRGRLCQISSHTRRGMCTGWPEPGGNDGLPHHQFRPAACRAQILHCCSVSKT